MWDAHTFASRHNHGLQPAQADHAAHIANAILRRGAPEGEAIATANKLVHRDAGGGVDPAQGGIGGLTPSTQTMNPMVRSMYQRYAALPVEKLQELNAMMGGTPQGGIVRAALQQRLAMPPEQQQPQISLPQATPQQQARGGEIKRPMGGGVSLSEASPWWTRREASGADQSSGFLAGTTPGRADSIKTSAPGGAYVLPADVISALGDGNSLAGARVMDEVLRSGPVGTPMPRADLGRGPPRPPAVSQREMEGIAKGGGVQGRGGNDQVPVALSHGEYTIGPQDVARVFGNGDLKHGHRVLDKFTLEVRRRHIAKLKSLRGPVGAKV